MLSVFARSWVVLIICVTVFYAGWAKFALSGYSIYLVDYGLRLAICVLTIYFGGLTLRPNLERNPAKMIGATIGILALILLTYWVYRFFYVPIPLLGLSLASFPNIENDWLRWLDLGPGIVLVALSEEFSFRYLFARAIPNSPALLYFASSIAFGILHAPQGLLLIVEATVSGFLLMLLYRKTGTLLAPVVVHFVTDVIIFSGVGCPYGMGDC
ncbi:membrane hypothetical protein [Rhodospirillaceae bacterium LM-1]|nr:membrane hypothetical protein [Rhodospirillaceae bacterium LM-1]